MSTLVSYLLAAILQFMGASMPKEQENAVTLTHQQCEETASLLPSPFTTTNGQKLKTSKEQSGNAPSISFDC